MLWPCNVALFLPPGPPHNSRAGGAIRIVCSVLLHRGRWLDPLGAEWVTRASLVMSPRPPRSSQTAGSWAPPKPELQKPHQWETTHVHTCKCIPCLHIPAHTCTCAHTRAIHPAIHVPVHAHTPVHAHMVTHPHISTPAPVHAHMGTHTPLHECMYITHMYLHMCAHACLPVCIYVCTYSCMHTHTAQGVSSWSEERIVCPPVATASFQL